MIHPFQPYPLFIVSTKLRHHVERSLYKRNTSTIQIWRSAYTEEAANTALRRLWSCAVVDPRGLFPFHEAPVVDFHYTPRPLTEGLQRARIFFCCEW
ncbi:hypothetical protein BC938DRAFT_474754 [Jimgerdemannia flammicorona]|uniref:Uncharacterized protein n=1 Tax=Jimgerdemannia flammicorona TaxID=994334 RepID=A0A433Q1P8_9FUNG|nr:hypothetical protein BC938DRAFT_474754 [Jimgerdemannia flammicorona]